MRRRDLLLAGIGALVMAGCGGEDADRIGAVDRTKAVQVALDTQYGRIIAEVYPDAAPVSANDFLAHVDQGLYEGAAFFRVVRPDNDNGTPPIEVIQMRLAEGREGLPPVAHETTQDTGLKHINGALSLARGAVGTGSAGSFFITIGDQPSLDYEGARNADGEGFAVFGRVIEGMDVVRQIQSLPTESGAEDAYVQGQILERPVTFTASRM